MSFNFNIEDSIVEGIIRGFLKDVRAKLISGESVEIDGIGTIRCKHRKVRNSHGRQFSIKLTVIQDKNFQRDLLESYIKDPSKFIDIKRCNE